MICIHRRLTLLGAALLFSAAATAQTFPSKPIRAVVPFAAGSATDQIGRAFAEKMSATLGQPIVVDNKPGANGMLGADIVAKAPPDGYTILIGTNSTNAALEVPDEEAALRPRHGLRAGGLHRIGAADGGGEQRRACKDAEGVCRSGQGQTRRR